MLQIDFFDMGQGDGILVRLPADNKNKRDTHILVDFGSLKNRNLVTNDALTYMATSTIFKQQGAILDLLVLSHADQDHYNQIPKFVEKLKPDIKNLLYSGAPKQYSAGFKNNDNLINWLVNKYPQMKILNSNGNVKGQLKMNWIPSTVAINVLAMNASGKFDDDPHHKNTNSVVLHLKYAGLGVVLSGDATMITEKAVLNSVPNNFLAKTVILKVGHHGSSRTSVSEDWVKALQPHFCVILSDRQGEYSNGHTKGFRLPQLCAIDLLTDPNLNPNIGKGYTKHGIVCSYDPEDYKKRNRIDPHTNRFNGAQWVQIDTDLGVYTTIYKMGMQGAAADLGAQYQFLMSQNGQVKVSY